MSLEKSLSDLEPVIRRKANHGILPPRNKPQGKTYLRLREIKADNANELLLRIGENYEHGTRGRQIRVQNIAAILR